VTAGVHHVALRTRDVAKLEAFYAGVLGLPIVKTDDGRSTWLRAGAVIVMLERAEPGEPEVPAGSMEMIAFSIAPEERADHTRRLEAAGFPPEAQTQFTLYVRDPDGRRVGLSHFERS
jgi:catechol 2,3-dioxygenase-like lactoylglutathione lyase family enzyme